MSPTRRRFAEVVRSRPVDVGLACLLVGGEVDPDLDVETWTGVLDSLAGTVRLPAGAAPAQVAEALRVALGEQAGFAGFAADYDDLRASLLPEVLARGRGLPLLLSVVWLEVCRRLGVPARPVALPGHVVVEIGRSWDDPATAPGGSVVVDPFTGGRVVAASVLAEHPPVPLGVDELLLRLLTNVRALTTRQPTGLGPATTRLWAVELSLLLPRHPAALRRERGELLVRLGRHLEGADELETYALVVEDADEAEAAQSRTSGRAARAQLN